MAIEDLVQDAGRRMDKSVEAAQAEFTTLRTGRASPALLDRVQIDYYGQQTPLKQLATISAPEPRMLTIQPFDPNSVREIERAPQRVRQRSHVTRAEREPADAVLDQVPRRADATRTHDRAP